MEKQIKYHRKTATGKHREDLKIDDVTALADKKKNVLELVKKTADESYLTAIPKMVKKLENALQNFSMPQQCR